MLQSKFTGRSTLSGTQIANRFQLPLTSSPTVLIRCAGLSSQAANASATAAPCPKYEAIRARRRFTGPPIDLGPHRASVSCRASKGTGIEPSSGSNDNLIGPIGIGALWLSLLVYAAAFSPNQTPYRDEIFIKLLVGLESDTTFSVNTVFYSIFNIMGIYPILYSALLIPSGRSGNKVPAWPFVAVSFFLGAFALLPYMAFWRPSTDVQSPPPKEELEGWNKLLMKGAETAVLPALLLAGSTYLIVNAVTAGGESWGSYFELFEESRLVHITTLDFCILTGLIPFWMYNDAEERQWESRDTFVPVLSLIPVIGPCVYLLLRPKSGDQ